MGDVYGYVRGKTMLFCGYARRRGLVRFLAIMCLSVGGLFATANASAQASDPPEFVTIWRSDDATRIFLPVFKFGGMISRCCVAMARAVSPEQHESPTDRWRTRGAR
jgi:hypothetical protein